MSHPPALTLELAAEHLPLGKGVEVVAVDPRGLVALAKPADVRSHPSPDQRHGHPLLRARYDEKRRAFGPLAADCPWPEVFLLHRLDAATSGILLLATSEAMAQAVREAFEREKVHKTYHAIVKGKPSPVPTVWSDRLKKRREMGKIRVSVAEGKPARTEQKLLRSDGNGLGISLVQLHPITGRTHQLRAQCQHRGHPILGDKTYGDFSWNRKLQRMGVPARLFLHAHAIDCAYRWQGETVHFKATVETPSEFGRIIERNRDLRKSKAEPARKTPTVAELQQQRLASLGKRPDALKQFKRERMAQQARLKGKTAGKQSGTHSRHKPGKRRAAR